MKHKKELDIKVKRLHDREKLSFAQIGLLLKVSRQMAYERYCRAIGKPLYVKSYPQKELACKG